jgi:hypothetical protein
MMRSFKGGRWTMNRIALLLGLALPLAACNSDPQVSAENASAEDVAKKIEAARGSTSFVNPGKWQSTVTLEQMTMPGMPPEVAERMKSMQGRAQVNESCLTPEDAKKPKEDFFSGNDNCRYERFEMGGGKIDAVMKCSEGGASQTVTMAGTYSGDAYNMQMSMNAAPDAEGQGAIAMKMKVDAKRIGACDGKES